MYEKEGLFADEKSISTGSGKRGASNNKGHSGKKRTKALIQNFLLLLCFYGLILTFNFMIGPQQWPHWSMLTNVVMAVGPGSLWLERGEKRGTRLGLAALIVAGTINTFSPYSQWVTAWPEVFNNPAYYFIGVCSTAAALFNFGIVASLPPKA